MSSAQANGDDNVKLPIASPDGVVAQLAKPGQLVRVTPEQEKILEQTFKENKNVDELTITIVAAETGLSEKDAKNWFQNRQALWREKEGLNPNSRSLND